VGWEITRSPGAVKIFEKRCSACGREFQVFRKSGVSVKAGWKQLGTVAKMSYIEGLLGFLGLAIMILTWMTGIGDYWPLFECNSV